MIHVLAHIELNPGTRESFLTEFHKIVAPVRAEDGCLEYGPTIDAATDIASQQTSPDRVIVVEKWESLAHLKAHLAAPHMLAYRPKVKNYVRQTILHITEPA